MYILIRGETWTSDISAEDTHVRVREQANKTPSGQRDGSDYCDDVRPAAGSAWIQVKRKARPVRRASQEDYVLGER